LYQHVSDIPLQRAQWNSLVARNATNTVFQTHEWFECWWAEFGAQHRLYFLLLRVDGEPVGFAPLMLAANTRHRQLKFVGAEHADYVDVVIASAHHARGVSAILEFLRSHSRDWDSVFLRNLPDGSPTTVELAAALRKSGLHKIRWGKVQCPALQLAGWEPQVEKLLAKYSLRRPTDWFARQGLLECRMLHTSAELRRYLPLFFEQHIARWAGTESPSRFVEPGQRRFFTRLAEQLLAATWLSFAVVELDGRLLACHFGFEYGGQLVWYKPSFDPKYRKHSPGLVLIRYLIKYALDTGLREFDFTIGDEAFKSRLATVRRSNTDLAIYTRRSQFLTALLQCSVRRAAGISIGGPRLFLRAATRGVAASHD
jgi:CelD/BcsL family acetyltransferase involved in cellulose biosynthesis